MARHGEKLICQTCGGNVMVEGCMAASGTRSPVFIDDVTADKSCRMNF